MKGDWMTVYCLGCRRTTSANGWGLAPETGTVVCRCGCSLTKVIEPADFVPIPLGPTQDPGVTVDVEDIWTGADDRSGHTPGAWDCPCGPWVLTDMDIPPSGLRTVRHVAFDAPRGQLTYGKNIGTS